MVPENIIALLSKEITTEVPDKSASNNKLLLCLIILFAVFFAFLLFTVIYQNIRERKLWGGNGKGLYKRIFSDQLISISYQFLTTFPLTRNYIDKLSYRYRLISPCNSKTIARKTVLACLISWSICIVTFILIFIINPKINTLIIAGVAIVIANSEVVSRMAKFYEITSLQDIQRLITNVEHYFYVEYRVDDALYRSLDSLSYNMKAAAEQIYQLLSADNKEEALREYYENIPNKFLREFVSQCFGVIERGDQVVEGKLLFIRNLENLHREIDIEIDKLQRLSMEFLGVIICVIAPIFCIDFVKQFAIDIKENMWSFYYGKEGFIFDIGLMITIAFIYLVMRKSAEYIPLRVSHYRWLYRIDKIPIIKKSMDNYCDKNASRIERLTRTLRNNGSNIKARHFVMRSFLIAIVVFALSIGIFFYLHMISREQQLTVNINDLETLTSAAKENQYEKIKEMIETYTKEYVTEPDSFPDSKEALVKILTEDRSFTNKVINTAMADEIIRRVVKYKEEYFSFLDLLISFSLSMFAYFLPRLILKYNSSVSKDAMEDEVNHFNALICMLMYIDSMTVKQILEEVEAFAVVFKESLRNCLNNYGAGDIKALEELKESEPYEPFQRIVDNLIRCDDMPIYQAFHEIDIERDGYMARRKLANEKSIRRRVMRAYFLAAIPFLLLFAYGVIPPLVASMTEINNMLAELENSAW